MSSQAPQDILRWLLDKIPGKHKRINGGWLIHCPAHGDETASATLKAYANGVGFKCFTGCTTQAICDALGIKVADLFTRNSSGVHGSRILHIYRYFYENGELAYEKLRMRQRSKEDPKFFYRRFDETGNELWTLRSGWFELKGRKWQRIEDASDNPQNSPKPGARWFDEARRVLYNESQLRNAPLGSLVLIPEGEKDAEGLKELGYLAVAYGGANDWREVFADKLAGHHLLFIGDNDRPGQVVVRQAAQDCLGKAASVRWIERMPNVGETGDYSDWKEAGGTDEEFRALIEAAPHYTPTAPPVEDESTAVEVEGDDPPISNDPKREKYLRQIARNTAKLLTAINLILQKLGFEKNHSRLINALCTIAPDKLGTIVAAHGWLARQYPNGGMSVDTVGRDIEKLTAEEKRLGVGLLGYTPGTRNPATGQGYASKFRRYYLRWALEAINIAIETRGDLEYSHDALSPACDEVVKRIPRQPVESVSLVESDASDCTEAQTRDQGSLKKQLRFKLLKTNLPLIIAAMKAGLSIEVVMEVVQEAENDLAERAALAAARMETEADIEPPLEAVEDKSADCISCLESLEINRTVRKNETVPTSPSSSPYSPHFADYMANDDPPPRPPEKVTCDNCDLPMPFGAETCPNCGSLHTASYWKAGRFAPLSKLPQEE
jgi:hypothetical protein